MDKLKKWFDKNINIHTFFDIKRYTNRKYETFFS